MSEMLNKIVRNKHLYPINPLICGYEKCDPRHSYGPAVREYWLLHFVVSGKGVFLSRRGETEVGENGVFIIRPDEITYYCADIGEPWEYYWIGFTSDIPLPGVLKNNDAITAPELRELFVTAMECGLFEDGGGEGYESFLCGIIWQILGVLQNKVTGRAEEARGYVRQALDMMESEYPSGLGVSDISERLHLNRSYFAVIFKDAVGVSPKQYLKDLRMTRASQLLSLGVSVTVTANSVGYPDVFAFSRAFKNYFGYPPTDQPKAEN